MFTKEREEQTAAQNLEEETLQGPMEQRRKGRGATGDGASNCVATSPQGY